MNLDDVIITIFCLVLVDEAIPHVLACQRLRQRGPQPKLRDSEVITMEMVGEYLGFEHASALFAYFAYFRHHYAHFFPTLLQAHRTPVVRPVCHSRQKLAAQRAALAILCGTDAAR